VNQEVTLWIFGAVITLQTAIVGAIAAALWVHVGHCKEIAAAMARVEARVERLSIDIGTHDTGLRGAVHETANRVTEHALKISMLERQARIER
jgi:hypothetical protein